MKTEQDCFATSNIRCPHCYSCFDPDTIEVKEIVCTNYGEVLDFKMRVTCPECSGVFYCYDVSSPEYTTTKIVDGKEMTEWQDDE